MGEGGSQDEGFSDSEVVYEEDVVEVVDLDQDRPPEDGKLTFTFGLLIVLLYSSPGRASGGGGGPWHGGGSC